MFEGQFNRADRGESGESPVLRQFRWTDLVARLAATRDLRDELARKGEGEFARFTELRRERGDDGKRSGNHDVLSDRKDRVVSLERTAKCAGDATERKHD